MDKMAISRFLQFFMIIVIFFSGFHASAQVEGCTDPYAINYNSAATWNDGSCIYEETVYTPVQYLDLPVSLEESSGLIYWSGGIWTFNDSGGDAAIYKVDTTNGEVIQTVTISGGNNVDWEDITQDEDHIYIGDFGNNAGNRKDLVVYKLEKTSIPDTGNVSVPAEIIAFSYADQDDFTPQFNDNEYDCEAIICVEGDLYLFTKNWVSETTRLYVMSTEPGTYSIMPVDSLDVEGLVTGAAYSDELKQIVLSGYSNYLPFLYLLFDYHENDFFSGNKRKIQMPGVFGAQTEGICFREGYQGFLSCEQSLFDQQVFIFNTAEWTDTTLLYTHELFNLLEINIHPNPYEEGDLTVEIGNPAGDSYRVSIFESSGKVVYSRMHYMDPGDTAHILVLQIPDIMPGIYLLHILSDDWYAKEKLIVR